MIIGLLTGIIKGARDKKRAEAASQEAQHALDVQQSQVDSFFAKEYYGDYLNRSDVQSTLHDMREQTRQQNALLRHTGAVSGATPEAVAAMHSNNARALGNAYSHIAAGASGWRSNVLGNYIDHSMANTNNRYRLYAGQAENFRNSTNKFFSSAADNADQLLTKAISGLM